MTALVGTEVKRTLSLVPGLCNVAGDVLGSAATEPQQADSKDGADLTEVGREVGVGGLAGHGSGAKLIPPRQKVQQKQSLIEAARQRKQQREV
jgi:hypothetical protein